MSSITGSLEDLSGETTAHAKPLGGFSLLKCLPKKSIGKKRIAYNPVGEDVDFVINVKHSLIFYGDGPYNCSIGQQTEEFFFVVGNAPASIFSSPEDEGKSDEAFGSSCFLLQLYRLVNNNQDRLAMQIIYKYLYNLRMQRSDRLIGRILEDLDVGKLKPSLLIAVLTITAPIKERLQVKRATFYRRAKEAITSLRGRDDAGRILVGLE